MNEEALRAVETRNELLDILRSRQERSPIGHVSGCDCLARIMLEG